MGDVKERPILFSGPMVEAILEGRKTQTRRVVKSQPKSNLGLLHSVDGASWSDRGRIVRCSYGASGDRLWCRETWAVEDCGEDGKRIVWRADRAARWLNRDGQIMVGEDLFYLPSDYEPGRWRPGIHMPRWASRLTLEVTEVRVQRLQEISEDDALAEGVEANPYRMADGSIDEAMSIPARRNFEALWDSINGERQDCSWRTNPWVWAISFKRLP